MKRMIIDSRRRGAGRPQVTNLKKRYHHALLAHVSWPSTLTFSAVVVVVCVLILQSRYRPEIVLLGLILRLAPESLLWSEGRRKESHGSCSAKNEQRSPCVVRRCGPFLVLANVTMAE
jgi:hypothetical protein